MKYKVELDSYQLLKLEILAGNKWFKQRDNDACDATEWESIVMAIKHAEEIDDSEDSQ